MGLKIFLAVAVSVVLNINVEMVASDVNETSTTATSSKSAGQAGVNTNVKDATNASLGQAPAGDQVSASIPPKPTTPKPIKCMTGTCAGIEDCINLLNNSTCSGVCTKTVKNKNATYGDYTVACNTTYNTCDKFNAANKNATPVTICCAESFCTKYIPSGNSASNISANFIVFILLTGFFRECLLRVSCL